MKYLVLIRSIALLHQHQREKKTVEHMGEVIEYIEVTLEDVKLANRLAHEVLGRSLEDMPPQTKRLLVLLDEMVSAACKRLAIARKDYRFTRKEVREATGWGNTQLKMHLHRLENLEYVVVRTGRGQHFEYELLYEGQGKDGAPFLCGLADVDALARGHSLETPEARSAPKDRWSGRGRGPVGPKSGDGRALEIASDENASLHFAADARAAVKNAHHVNGQKVDADRLLSESRGEG
jgi:hypothetical protein